jgi:thymidylate synthase (FAD)
MEDGAQKEIRDYANAIYDLVAPLAPLTMKAFRDFRLNNMQLSAIEIDCIKNNYLPESIGEKREFVAKLDRLGLSLKLFPNGIP